MRQCTSQALGQALVKQHLLCPAHHILSAVKCLRGVCVYVCACARVCARVRLHVLVFARLIVRSLACVFVRVYVCERELVRSSVCFSLCAHFSVSIWTECRVTPDRSPDNRPKYRHTVYCGQVV